MEIRKVTVKQNLKWTEECIEKAFYDTWRLQKFLLKNKDRYNLDEELEGRVRDIEEALHQGVTNWKYLKRKLDQHEKLLEDNLY